MLLSVEMEVTGLGLTRQDSYAAVGQYTLGFNNASQTR